MTEIEELRTALDALTARLQALEDQVELAQVVARYGPAVDSGSGQATAELWTEDGRFFVPPLATWVGHDEIAGMVGGPAHQALITSGAAHVLTAPRVVVEGDTARGWNYALNIRWDPDEERFWIARISANEWTWRRDPSGWRVLSRENRNLDGSVPPRDLFRRCADTS